MPKHRDMARDAALKLNNVIASPAPEPVRIAAKALLACIARGAAGDHPERIDADAKLAVAVGDLPSVITLQVDFLRVLNGERVAWTRHSMRNIRAALRTRERQLGRTLVDTDFPADHPARLLALAYWGGIDAWSAGSTQRTQHPKGHWSRRENQIAAIQSAVAKYPGVPVTHALLRIAGLHRLAVILDAAQLALLADEAGVDRALAYKVGGWWTADRVIDAYAEECRRARVTLSSWALTAIGGQASSLRVYAARHFESFRAFQSAVIKRHPDILPARRPIAADGTRLDSWSEVVAYHALREALPETLAQLYVLGEKRESFVAEARIFLDGLRSHYWLDAGKLVVAHAGLPENMHGRGSGAVRGFALYGETTGETDEFGLPVRYEWARDYRGKASVVYGHTPVSAPEWLNRTLCIDTGCVYGGALTALRYPERDIVSVAAHREYVASVRPLVSKSLSGRFIRNYIAF